MVVYHLNLDVASRLMVGFFFHTLGGLSQMHDLDLQSPFYFHPKWGQHLPYAQLVHQKQPTAKAQGNLAGISGILSMPQDMGKLPICHEKFKILPSFCEYGFSNRVAPRDVELLWIYDESFVLRSLLYGKFAERKAQKILSNFFFGFQTESCTFSLPCYSEREII